MSAARLVNREYAAELRRALAHPSVQRLQGALTSRVAVDATPQPQSRLAAVMAVLRVVGNGAGAVELLFIKRAVVARDPWSGHIAFPGGRHDATDASLEATALRETREEVSLDIAQTGRVLGRVDDLAPRSPLLPPIIVRPFVAVVPASLEIVPNHEVADAFWTPVSQLLEAAGKSEHELSVSGEALRFPAYAVREYVVWGLTERIVTQLLPLFG